MDEGESGERCQSNGEREIQLELGLTFLDPNLASKFWRFTGGASDKT